MAVIKVYTRINWLNKSESLTTPLGKTNLNKMDKAIDTIDNEVVSISATMESLDTTKADKDQLNNMITDIAVNDKNGVISITKYNGTVLNIDTAMEKIAVNFEYNAQTQQLILTLENGEKQYIDMSALITQYEFKDTDTIAFSVDSSGKVSASIKSGSITKAMLSSEVMSAITLSENNAAASAQAAAQSATNAELDAKLSQSYSVGKSGIRDGEDIDNAKYYKEQAQDSSDSASNSASSALASSQTATTKASEAATSATNASKSESNANTYATNAKNSATSASSSAITATQKASEASTSATNASNSANTATTKANEAKSSANAAALSESNALASKTAAAQSESNAKTSESNASNSAKSASASATSASSSATIATNKATEAANSASDASDSANTATAKASEASSSASSARQSASLSDTYSTKAQSYAVGGTGTRENENTDNAKYYYHQAKAISESFSGTLRPMGTVTFANLPSVSSATEGDMYNVSDEFVTTSDFKEGSGNVIPQGSNVYKTADEKWDVLAGSPVTGVKGATETTYRRGNVNITPEDIGIIVDSKLSAISTNPVQNKVIYSALNGKANTNHTHTKSQISDFNKQLTSEDLNDIKDVGFYFATGYNTATNKPSGVGGFGLEVIQSAGGWYTQLLYDSNEVQKSYRRWWNGSKWSDWEEEKITDTTYSNATTSSNGLMSSTDKTKLDGIAEGANKTIVDSALSSTSTNPVQNKVVYNEMLKRMALQWIGAEHYDYYGIGEPNNNTSSSSHYYVDVETGKLYVYGGTQSTWTYTGTTFPSVEEVLNSKLSISNIANNLVTTEEGYALDARQGKALKDEITVLNNILSKNLNRNYQNILPPTKITKSQYYRADFPNINIDNTMLYCRIIDNEHCQYNLMDMGDFLALPIFKDVSKYGWRILADSDGSYVSIYYDATNKQIIVYSSYDDVEVGLWAFNWKF